MADTVTLTDRHGLRTATFGPKGLADPHRYRLTRRLKLDGGTATPRRVAFVMLNPSKASHLEDDPTVKKCTAFAQAWGFGELVVGNVYAYRATDPAELLTAKDPMGPANVAFIRSIAAEAEFVVCAWGNTMPIDNARMRVTLAGWDLRYLKLNKDWSPAHPLYLRGDLVPQSWRPA